MSGLGWEPAAAAGGFGHSVALRRDGTVWSWGYNQRGELGNGQMGDSSPLPAAVPGVTEATAVAAGDEFVLALRRDGSVWGWGDDAACELADDSRQNRARPAPLPGLKEIVAIAASGHHAAALAKDGTVWTWGQTDAGTLASCTPVPVAGSDDAKAIAAGSGHTLLLEANGTVATLGDNDYGQLGDGGTLGRAAPLALPDLKVAAVAGGARHSLAVDHDGTVLAWGGNLQGQIGNGLFGDDATFAVPTPTPVLGRSGKGNLNALAAAGANLPPAAHDAEAVMAAESDLPGQTEAGDAEGDRLRYSVVEGPAYGRVELKSDGRFDYRPDAGFAGSDRFRFQADDGQNLSNVATVTIGVVDCGVDKNPVNREAAVPATGNCALAENDACDFDGDGFANDADRALRDRQCGAPPAAVAAP